ncbi:virginiamycin B lyase family protein [Candidatus Rariloculus sp.]|uniref:Vgb family protein n=1 Tax=Candidatus Rariloculus sp. TaxID=3101265 RepID=UPI003D10BC4D
MYQLCRHLPTAVVLCISLPVCAQTSLPDGPGKEFVEAACVACHQTNLIANSAGYTHERWRSLIGKMMDLEEPLVGDITQYLAANFPEKYDRRPTLVSGDARVTFLEWDVPTLGQRPRDPLMTPDGMIWWAGMYGSLIGRLDPGTGEMTEWKLDPEARPHSIIDDAEGNIWYTGNGNGTMGMLDPETGEITVYPMPDPDARDPHTPVVTNNGDIWFTLQNSDMLGRLVPDMGDIRLTGMPTERARPYGIKEDSDGMIWVAYRGAPKIARIDPDSWEIVEFATPNPDPQSHHGNYYIRRLAIDSNDTIWYVDSGRGYLGRLDPETGETREWLTPSGPGSHPYAIEIIDDIVWFNESAQRPDVLVRFDPETEQFQSWAIPSGVGIIRHMRATHDGNLVIHQSSTNTVGLVLIDHES